MNRYTHLFLIVVAFFASQQICADEKVWTISQNGYLMQIELASHEQVPKEFWADRDSVGETDGLTKEEVKRLRALQGTYEYCGLRVAEHKNQQRLWVVALGSADRDCSKQTEP